MRVLLGRGRGSLLREALSRIGPCIRKDITWAIEQMDPDYIVPIHTEVRDWFTKSFENVVLIDEGRSYEL